MILDRSIVLTDGRQLGYAEYGNMNGFPVFYFHGSQSSRLERHYDMSFTEKSKIRIISVDRPGHGLSDLKENRKLLDFSDDIIELADQLGIDTFSAVGMSAGGPYALGVAYTNPERITSIGLISSFAPYYKKETRPYLSKKVNSMLKVAKSFPWVIRLMMYFQRKQIIKNPDKILNNFLDIMSSPDKELLKKVKIKRMIKEMFIEAYRKGSKGVAYEITNILVRDWKFELNKINVPVKIWQGEKDNNVPKEWGKYLAENIPNSTLELFPNEGHLLIFEHAEKIFTELINLPNKV